METILAFVCGLVLFFLLNPYLQSNPSSLPPLENRNSRKHQTEKRCRKKNRSKRGILKACRDCRKKVEETQHLALILQSHLRKFHDKVRFLQLLREDAPGEVFKPTPAGAHQPLRQNMEDPSSTPLSFLASLVPLTKRSLPLTSSEETKDQSDLKSSPLATVPQNSLPGNSYWASLITAISGLDCISYSILFLSWWWATTKALFFSTWTYIKSQQEEHLSHHPPDSALWGDPKHGKKENGNLSFINPNVQKLLEMLITKRVELKTWKENAKVESSFKQMTPEHYLDSLGNMLKSLGGKTDTNEQVLWNTKGKARQLHDSQHFSYPKALEEPIEHKCIQLFWGLPSLHSESLVATAWVPNRSNSARYKAVTFNQVDTSPVQTWSEEPPQFSQDQPLPHYMAQSQFLTQNLPPSVAQVQTHTHLPPPSSPPQHRICRTICPTSQKELWTVIPTENQHVEWTWQNQPKQRKILPSAFQTSQEPNSQFTVNHCQGSDASPDPKSVFILPGDSSSTNFQEQHRFITDEYKPDPNYRFQASQELPKSRSKFSRKCRGCQGKDKHGSFLAAQSSALACGRRKSVQKVRSSRVSLAPKSFSILPGNSNSTKLQEQRKQERLITDEYQPVPHCRFQAPQELTEPQGKFPKKCHGCQVKDKHSPFLDTQPSAFAYESSRGVQKMRSNHTSLTLKSSSILSGNSNSAKLQEQPEQHSQDRIIPDEYQPKPASRFQASQELTEPQGKFPRKLHGWQAKEDPFLAGHHPSAFACESGKGVQKVRSRSSERHLRSLEQDPDLPWNSRKPSVKVLADEEEDSQSDLMRPGQCSSGSDITRGSNRKHVEKILHDHLGRKLAQINEGIIPVYVRGSWIAAKNTFPMLNTHKKTTNRTSSKAQQIRVNTSQELSFLDPGTRLMLETDIMRSRVRHRWSPHPQAFDSKNHNPGETPPLPLPLLVFPSLAPYDSSVNSITKDDSFPEGFPWKGPGEVIKKMSVPTLQSPLPSPSPAEVQKAWRETPSVSSNWPLVVLPTIEEGHPQPHTSSVLGRNQNRRIVMGTGRGSLKPSPRSAMARYEPWEESGGADSRDPYYDMAMPEIKVGSQFLRAEEIWEIEDEPPPDWEVTAPPLSAREMSDPPESHIKKRKKHLMKSKNSNKRDTGLEDSLQEVHPLSAFAQIQGPFTSRSFMNNGTADTQTLVTVVGQNLVDKLRHQQHGSCSPELN